MDDQCKYNTYTYFMYNRLWFIDHPKKIHFHIPYFTISKQFNYAHKFNSVVQFNSVMLINYLKSIQLCQSIQLCKSIISNQFNYVNQFSYALNEFNLCLRYIGYQSHRHGPAGLQAGIKRFYNTVRSRWAADWL